MTFFPLFPILFTPFKCYNRPDLQRDYDYFSSPSYTPTNLKSYNRPDLQRDYDLLQHNNKNHSPHTCYNRPDLQRDYDFPLPIRRPEAVHTRLQQT